MKISAFQILNADAKAAIASLWEEYAKAAKAEDGGADLGSFKVVATTDDTDRDASRLLGAAPEKLAATDFTAFEFVGVHGLELVWLFMNSR